MFTLLCYIYQVTWNGITLNVKSVKLHARLKEEVQCVVNNTTSNRINLKPCTKTRKMCARRRPCKKKRDILVVDIEQLKEVFRF